MLASQSGKIVNDVEKKIHTTERLNASVEDNFGVSKDFSRLRNKISHYKKNFRDREK